MVMATMMMMMIALRGDGRRECERAVRAEWVTVALWWDMNEQTTVVTASGKVGQLGGGAGGDPDHVVQRFMTFWFRPKGFRL